MPRAIDGSEALQFVIAIRRRWWAHVLLALGVSPYWNKVTVSAADRKPSRDPARENPPRHPANDPSGAEPAGASTGIPGRDFADAEIAEAEADRARVRRESDTWGEKLGSDSNDSR